jgi:hypothetical protein
MLRKSGDLVGLPITEVTGHTENAINCDRQHLTFMDLIKLSIGVDGCGKPALRVKKIDTCTLNATCDNAVVNDNLNKIFAYDSTEKTFAIVLNETA